MSYSDNYESDVQALAISSYTSTSYSNMNRTSNLSVYKQNVHGNISLEHISDPVVTDSVTGITTGGNHRDILKIKAVGQYNNNNTYEVQNGQIYMDSDTFHNEDVYNAQNTYHGSGTTEDTGFMTGIWHGNTKAEFQNNSVEYKVGADVAATYDSLTASNPVLLTEAYLNGSKLSLGAESGTLVLQDNPTDKSTIESSVDNGISLESTKTTESGTFTGTATVKNDEVKLSQGSQGDRSLTLDSDGIKYEVPATNEISYSVNSANKLKIKATETLLESNLVSVETDLKIGVTTGTTALPVLEYDHDTSNPTLKLQTEKNTVNIGLIRNTGLQTIATTDATTHTTDVKYLADAAIQHFDTGVDTDVSAAVGDMNNKYNDFVTYLEKYKSGLKRQDSTDYYPLEAKQLGPILYLLNQKILNISGGVTVEYLNSISELAAELQRQSQSGSGGLILLDELQSLRKHVSLLAAKMDSLTSLYDELQLDDLQEELLTMFDDTDYPAVVSYLSSGPIYPEHTTYSSVDEGVFYRYRGYELGSGGVVPKLGDDEIRLTNDSTQVFYYNGFTKNGFLQDKVQSAWGFCTDIKLVSEYFDGNEGYNGYGNDQDITDDFIPSERVFSRHFTSTSNTDNSKYICGYGLNFDESYSGYIKYDPFYGILCKNGRATIEGNVTIPSRATFNNCSALEIYNGKEGEGGEEGVTGLYDMTSADGTIFLKDVISFDDFFGTDTNQASWPESLPEGYSLTMDKLLSLCDTVVQAITSVHYKYGNEYLVPLQRIKYGNNKLNQYDPVPDEQGNDTYTKVSLPYTYEDTSVFMLGENLYVKTDDDVLKPIVSDPSNPNDPYDSIIRYIQGSNKPGANGDYLDHLGIVVASTNLNSEVAQIKNITTDNPPTVVTNKLIEGNMIITFKSEEIDLE